MQLCIYMEYLQLKLLETNSHFLFFAPQCNISSANDSHILRISRFFLSLLHKMDAAYAQLFLQSHSFRFSSLTNGVCARAHAGAILKVHLQQRSSIGKELKDRLMNTANIFVYSAMRNGVYCTQRFKHSRSNSSKIIFKLKRKADG